jgi:hypothetical protein
MKLKLPWQELAVLALFFFLTVLMLWPLPIFMSDRLISPVDPLLNTWIMAWNIHQLQINPLDLFQANIFFPLANTLAFSEHLLVLSLIAAPVILITGNPILGYNFLQFLSYVLSGFAAYLMVYHLTKNRMAGIISGIIFAFHPYRFRQVGHIQNIAIFWIPLCLLYWHKLVKNPKTKYFFLFSLFFVLQVLSCGYLGVFLSVVLLLAMAYYFLFTPKKKILTISKKMIVAAVLAAVVIAPFLYPYMEVKKEHSFERSEKNNIKFSANMLGYVIISRFNENVFYHSISRKFRFIMMQTDKGRLRPIGRGLFPGIITILLVLYGCISLSLLRRQWQKKHSQGQKKFILKAEKVNHYLILIACLSIALILISRQASLTLLVFILLLLFIIKIILSRFTLDGIASEKAQFFINRNFYLFMGILTLILSLGPRLFFITHNFGRAPYSWLYRYIFFFKGIRVPERFGILTMLAISVLAGYGVVQISTLLKSKGRVILSSIICGLLICEFICVPLPSTQIPREPAEVYKWLASDKEQYGILEYPLENQQQNKYYMYWSTFHWKKLVNGSSGFNPHFIHELKVLAHQQRSFPNRRFIRFIKSSVPVKYLILHLENYSEAERRGIFANAAQFAGDMKLVQIFGNNDFVYEFIYED